MADWRPPRPQRPPQIIVNSGNEGRREDSLSTAGTPMSSRNLLPQFHPTSRYMRAPVAHPSYNYPHRSQSSERLATPTTAQGTRFYHAYSPQYPSPLSSRRTSWESTGSKDNLQGPLTSPFDDPSAPSNSDGDINTQTVAEKYNIVPTPDLILFPEDVEEDDYLHSPDPNELDKNRFDIWSKRGMINVGGLILITLGVLALFVAYPVLYGPCYPYILCSLLTMK